MSLRIEQIAASVMSIAKRIAESEIESKSISLLGGASLPKVFVQ